MGIFKDGMLLACQSDSSDQIRIYRTATRSRDQQLAQNDMLSLVIIRASEGQEAKLTLRKKERTTEYLLGKITK